MAGLIHPRSRGKLLGGMLRLAEKVSDRVLRATGAKSHRVRTSVGDVHAYDLRGPGRGTFVLLHGIGANATGYGQVARRLRPEARRILMVDLPGHGRSGEPEAGLDVPSLGAGLAEALEVLIDEREPVGLLGNSLGGAAALTYALDRPERVRSLLLLSPGGAPLTDEELLDLRSRFDLKTRLDARRFLTELLHAPPWYMRLIERGLVEELGRPILQRFLASLRSEDLFTRERLAALQVPATVLWGASDRVLPRSALEFYREALPAGSVVEELPDIGHSPHLEAPGLVVRRLIEAHRRAS